MRASPLHHSFDMQVDMLIARLQKAPACSSAQEAHDALLGAWQQVHRDCQSSPRYQAALAKRRLCAEHGWRDLDKAACYFDSDEQPPIRIYLHRDGSMVIQRMEKANADILFTAPGKRQTAPTERS